MHSIPGENDVAPSALAKRNKESSVWATSRYLYWLLPPEVLPAAALDHYVPFAWGGPTTVENGQHLCSRCNKRKGERPMRV